jgi:hypothetical protein
MRADQEKVRHHHRTFLFASGVVNVENFYRVTRYPIEDFVWISDQRCDTHARPLGNFLCALRPSGDARNDRVKPILERIGNSGVMVCNVVEDTIEVSKRLGSITTLMQGGVSEKPV